MQRKDIVSLLIRLGISPSLRGFDYIITGIQLIDSDEELLHKIVKGLYPAIAEKYNTTSAKAERSIRSAVEKISFCTDDALLAEVFGNLYVPNSKRIKNSEFFGAVFEYFKEA